jgi:hypothetical protein
VVKTIVPPGSAATIPISFAATQNVADVSVNVDEALQPYVQVMPSRFYSVDGNETETLQLSLNSLPADPVLGSFVAHGAIRIHAKTEGNESIFLGQALPVALFGLPADPGEAGKATLEGIDSDGDGLRDDVQRFIALSQPSSVRIRAALTQEAVALQRALLDSASETESAEHARAIDHAIECQFFVVPGDGAAGLAAELESEVVNTEARLAAYLAFQAHLTGKVFPAPPHRLRHVSCAFDPDVLPD